MAISAEQVLAEIGPVQEVLDAHDGVVTVLDTSDGNIMLSLDGGCTGCSSTPMTAMQIFYALMKLDDVNDVIFVPTVLITLPPSIARPNTIPIPPRRRTQELTEDFESIEPSPTTLIIADIGPIALATSLDP